MDLMDKLASLARRYDELNNLMAQPEVDDVRLPGLPGYPAGEVRRYALRDQAFEVLVLDRPGGILLHQGNGFLGRAAARQHASAAPPQT